MSKRLGTSPVNAGKKEDVTEVQISPDGRQLVDSAGQGPCRKAGALKVSQNVVKKCEVWCILKPKSRVKALENWAKSVNP